MAPLHIELLTDDERLATLAADWTRLLALTPTASGFQSLAWIGACRTALPGPPPLFTLVASHGDEVVGILPTTLHRGGVLRFVGEAVSNYLGPVYHPGHVLAVTAAWAEFLAHDARVRLIDLCGLRTGSPFRAALCDTALPGFGPATAVETASCPYVDLRPGWEEIYARRKGKQPANFARKWAGLERLGALAFLEITDADAARARLPALFALFAGRWQGRHESGGFASRYRAFHEHALVALAAAGVLRLSVLELDGRVVAFSYGVRGATGTSSYVLAHDERLNVCSPGTLLLRRVLESPAGRGEPEYAFSLGIESYKDQWAGDARAVVRVVRARQRSVAALAGRAHVLASRAWVAARAIGWLRDLRREGLHAIVAGDTSAPPPDGPGLCAGVSGEWHVHRVPAMPKARRPLAPRPLTFAEMTVLLSPRLLELAVDRSFRGDVPLVLDRGGERLGIVWRAAANRRGLVTGGAALPPDLPVYYHPVADRTEALPYLLRALAEIDDSTELVVVTPAAQTVLDCTVHRFVADHRFQAASTSLAAP